MTSAYTIRGWLDGNLIWIMVIVGSLFIMESTRLMVKNYIGTDGWVANPIGWKP